MRHDLDDILLGELHPFRRISRSVWEMAILTGILGRVLHAFFSAPGEPLDWWGFAGRFILIPIVVLGMAAVHLSNYSPRDWVWRAPVFSLVEAVTAALMSLLLIGLGRERWGTARAEWGDWPWMAGGILFWHVLAICAFAALLGGVVQWVRRREAISELEARAEKEENPPIQG